MMDMQEVKPRKAHARRDDDGGVQEDSEHIGEVDPSVQTAPLLSDADPRGRSRATPFWLQYVLDRVWSAIFFGVACVGLYEAQFVHEVLYAPEAHRAYVNLGILFSTLVVLFGSYIELYRSMILGEKVRYENAKTSTHAMLFSMCAAGVCFSIGLWPIWHWLTLPYLFMWFWGVIVQIVVLFPVQLQRVIFAVGYLWFMHTYLSLFVV
ncbi:hypothetical protein FI667_g8822, partial [Globisporangium splendens]